MELISIINRFINQENTDFAILINGNWGSGKTFFLKNIIADEVKKSFFINAQKESIPYDLVYVSLYGLTSADELQKRLFLEINPSLKTKTGKITAALISKGLSYFGVDNDEGDQKALLNIFGGIPKHKVLVFDDLERLETETINEVLGFINSYTEHQNLKVIIVADEERIKEKIPDYDKVKEKLVRFTYLFNPRIEDVYSNFVNKYSQVYKNFLTEQSIFICNLFDKGEYKNLRSLRFVLDVFEDIFSYVANYIEITDESKKLLLKRFLFFTTTYSIEYKKDGKEEHLTSLKSLSNTIDSPAVSMSFIRQLASKMTKDDGNKAPESDAEKFKEHFEVTYLTEENPDFEYYDFLVRYIHSGDLSETDLKTICISSQNALIEQKDKPEQIVLNKLKNCLVLNDEEFIPLIEEIYDYVDQGVYKLDIYPIIFQNLLNCSQQGIEGIQIDQNTVHRFKAGMDISLQHSIYHFAFKTAFHSSYHGQDSTLVDELIEYAVELNRSLWVSENKKLAEEIFASLVPNKIQEFGSLLVKEEARTVPIFIEEYISANEFLTRYSTLSNSDKNSLSNTFYEISSRYQDFNHRRTSKDELSFFQALLSLINQKLESAEGKKHLSTFIDERFKASLEHIVKHIQALPQFD